MQGNAIGYLNRCVSSYQNMEIKIKSRKLLIVNIQKQSSPTISKHLTPIIVIYCNGAPGLIVALGRLLVCLDIRLPLAYLLFPEIILNIFH